MQWAGEHIGKINVIISENERNKVKKGNKKLLDTLF